MKTVPAPEGWVALERHLLDGHTIAESVLDALTSHEHRTLHRALHHLTFPHQGKRADHEHG